MTRTIARLVLAMLLLPVTGSLFVILIATMAAGGPPHPLGVLLIWLPLYVFVAGYWVLLWRDSVNWTRGRIMLTSWAAVAALLSGGVLGFFTKAVASAPLAASMLVGGGLPPIVWVLATVLIWRETRGERMDRLTASGKITVRCPLCSYDLTGLSEARCPECGEQFTLDELVKSQPFPTPTDVLAD